MVGATRGIPRIQTHSTCNVIYFRCTTLGGVAPGWLGVLDSAGTIVLVVGPGYLLVRILALLQRRLL